MSAYGSLIFTFLVSMTYAVVAPLISPFAFMIFGLAYVVLKYQHIHVYETKIESGGSWWPRVFSMLCICIGAFQLMTFCCIYLIAGKRATKVYAPLSAWLIFVSFVFTVIFHYYVKGKFMALSSVMKESIPPKEHEELGHHVSDPAFYQPLEKVWMKPEFVSKWKKENTSSYDSTVNYLVKTVPSGAMVLQHRLFHLSRNMAMIKQSEWTVEKSGMSPPPEWTSALYDEQSQTPLEHVGSSETLKDCDQEWQEL